MTQQYQTYYRPGAVTYCPGCQGTQWWVGRFSAECARCHTAIEMRNDGQRMAAPAWRRAA